MSYTINAATDPETANRLVEQVLAGGPIPEEFLGEAPAKPVSSTVPAEFLVDLPCGIFDFDKGLIREAEVRELDGFDEEALSKVGEDFAAFMQILLERGVVRLGDKKPTKGDIDSLLAGDAIALILAIRRVTYGTDLISAVICRGCQKAHQFDVDLLKDIPVTRLGSLSDHSFSVKTSKGEAVLSHISWEAQKDMDAKSTVAEKATALLKHCVTSINDMPVYDENAVRRLSIRDRGELVEAVSERSAGPRLGEVSKACPSCETQNEIPLSVVALFQF